ncbi:hypothetical protein [Zavarzinella formosa]|uniref:hypothetical protein n=1 Tax=Zavarzinella formosa TaxID=360055 RepID=UPI0002EAB28F|nr:hypothetical protein [Zavarzinella formosa]
MNEEKGDPKTPVGIAAEVRKQAAEKKMRPSFWAEMMAAFRGGREDLWNAIIPAFLNGSPASREPGAPRNPTQQIVTDDLLKDDKPKDVRKSVLGHTLEPTPEKPKTNDQSLGL